MRCFSLSGDEFDAILKSLNDIEKAVDQPIPKPPQPVIGITDEELRQRIPIVRVIGVGGGGNNTVSNLTRRNVPYVETIAVNTDARQLLHTKAHKKILIGEKICKGYGAGSDPKIGEAAAEESKEVLKAVIEDTDLLFITCGLGGGTGSGAAPVIAKLAHESNILTVTICTLPFSAEGLFKMKIAENALKKLIPYSNTIIIIPNDKLLELKSANIPLRKAFAIVDKVLVNSVLGIVELIHARDPIMEVDVDFSDIQRLLEYGGTAVIGIGEVEGNAENRVEIALEGALNNPLLDVRIETARSALINITGGDDLTLAETHKIIESVYSILKKDEDPLVKFGVVLDNNMNGKLRVTIMLAGIEIPYIDENGNLIYPAIIRRHYDNKSVLEKLRDELGISIETI